MRDANVSATLTKARKEIEELSKDNKKDQLKQKEIISSAHTELISQINPKILRQKFITAIGNHSLGTNIEERYDALINRVY
jgi:phosphoenolpyruvate-protein kinase (PTS system EI component)